MLQFQILYHLTLTFRQSRTHLKTYDFFIVPQSLLFVFEQFFTVLNHMVSYVFFFVVYAVLNVSHFSHVRKIPADGIP